MNKSLRLPTSVAVCLSNSSVTHGMGPQLFTSNFDMKTSKQSCEIPKNKIIKASSMWRMGLPTPSLASNPILREKLHELAV